MLIRVLFEIIWPQKQRDYDSDPGLTYRITSQVGIF